MATEPEWLYIHQEADKYLDYFQRAFIVTIENLKTAADVEVIEEAIRKGDPAFFENYIDWDEKLNKPLDNLMTPKIKKIMSATGARALADLNLSLRFSLENPYVYDYIKKFSTEKITFISDGSRKAINTAIYRAYESGYPPEVLGRNIRKWIGLTEKQMIAVQNYWAEMAGDSLRTKRADEMAEAYKRRLIRQRALNIARTESMDAANHGALTSWRQARDEGYVNPDAKKEWIASAESERTCEHCASLDGQQVGLDEQFYCETLGIYIDCPTLHPGGRCCVALRTPE